MVKVKTSVGCCAVAHGDTLEEAEANADAALKQKQAERRTRETTLRRWITRGVVARESYNPLNERGFHVGFHVGQSIFFDVTTDPDFPSERLIANLFLAIQASEGTP